MIDELLSARENKWKCDYCKRIVRRDANRSFPCTACGHGILHHMKPKTYCCVCGKPLYGNLSAPPVLIQCSGCTDMISLALSGNKKAVDRVLPAIEKLNHRSYNQLHGILQRQQIKNAPDGNDLAQLRKSMHLTQRILALKIGVTQAEISYIEQNRKPLNTKVLKFIQENPRGSAKAPQIIYQNPIDNKQVNVPEKWGHGHSKAEV